MQEQEYILTMLVENKPSVTTRVTGLFSGRGYNLESICGGSTHQPGISRITVKTRATPAQFEEIQKQLNRLIDVIKLRDMTLESKAVKREMALISVGVSETNRTELIQLVNMFGAKIIYAGSDSYIVEMAGSEDSVNSLIGVLEPIGIKKLTRSGVLALYKELEDSHLDKTTLKEAM